MALSVEKKSRFMTAEPSIGKTAKSDNLKVIKKRVDETEVAKNKTCRLYCKKKVFVRENRH